MVYRIYVEKKPGFDGEAQGLLHELTELLGIKSLTGLRLLKPLRRGGHRQRAVRPRHPHRVQRAAGGRDLHRPARSKTVFAVEYLPGQFDQRADSASQCIQLLSQGERPDVRSAKVYCWRAT